MIASFVIMIIITLALLGGQADEDDIRRSGIDMSGFENCGSCRHHKNQDEEWVCDNPDSDNYGLETDYSASCEQQESR